MDALVAFRVSGVEVDGAVIGLLAPHWYLDDPIKLLGLPERRVRQRAYLARYGRQDFFDQTRMVIDLDAATRAISQIVSEESALSRMGEDAG